MIFDGAAAGDITLAGEIGFVIGAIFSFPFIYR
jgi:hypothetical protein